MLSRSYHAVGCKLVGGEPLLHPDLIAVMRAVKESGVAERLQITTNGLLLPSATSEFWQLVDEVFVSHYPGRCLPETEYPRLARVAASHGARFEVSYFDYFRESYAAKGTKSTQLIRRIYGTCKMAHVWFCHTVHEGRFYKCPQSVFISLGTDALVSMSNEDGVLISDDADCSRRIRSYLESPEPLTACQRCLGSVGQRFAHTQIQRSEWRTPQDHTVEELLDREFLLLLEGDADADEGCVRIGGPIMAAG